MRAVIYTRISTDEKKQKYSPEFQRNALERYCKMRGIPIAATFMEDCTGKHFDRPQFKKMVEFVKANRRTVDYIFVLKFDRWGRNLEQAWGHIRRMREIGVEVNSSEQPIDFSSPEAKVMLAIYLITGEMESDKISSRTRDGNDQAMRDGCWIASPPIGYERAWTADGHATIKPGKDAPLVRRAFDLYVNTDLSMNEVRKQLIEEGYRKISKQGFINMLRKPVYMGKILVRAYKDMPEQMVDAKHEGLISEELFEAAQRKMRGKKRKTRKPRPVREGFELRGFLMCSKCGKKLTGSTSRSRNKSQHSYYHCQKGCTERMRADDANRAFVDFLGQLRIPSGVSELYLEILKEEYKGQADQRQKEINRIAAQITDIEKRIEKAQDSFFDGVVGADDYKRAKSRYEDQIEDLQEKLQNLRMIDDDVLEQAEFGLNLLSNLDEYYKAGDIIERQQLVGSIFGQTLTFSENAYRTTEPNLLVDAIAPSIKEYSADTKKPATDFSDWSTFAPPLGLEPRTL